MTTIGEKIKKVRNKLGLTQDDLVRKPGVQKIAKIAKVLGVFMEDLIK